MKKLATLVILMSLNLFSFEGSPIWNWDNDIPGSLENGTLKWYTTNPCTNNPNWLNIFQRAFDDWQIPYTKVKTTYGGQSSGQQNIISFVKGMGIYWGMAYNYDGYFQIIINDDLPWTDEMLYTTILHEIGHILGLQHNPNDPNTLMYWSAPIGTVIGQDEINAMQAWYPDPNYIPPATPLQAVISTSIMSGIVPFTTDLSSEPSTGNITNYLWDFGDGTTSTEKTTDHTYTTPGDYKVTLTVSDSNNISATSNITVSALEAPQVNIPQSFKFKIQLKFKANKANLNIMLPVSMILTSININGHNFNVTQKRKFNYNISDPNLINVLQQYDLTQEKGKRQVSIPMVLNFEESYISNLNLAGIYTGGKTGNLRK